MQLLDWRTTGRPDNLWLTGYEVPLRLGQVGLLAAN